MSCGQPKGSRCFLLLTLCCYVVVFISFDEYMFESSVILETRVKTRMALNANESTKAMFTLDRSLLYSESNNNNNSSSRKPLILMWEPAFGVIVPNPNACGDCVLTYDQDVAKEADAIIFHFAETRNSIDWLPWQHRNPAQRWVWLCLEPPWNVRHVFQKTLTGLRGVFNWTMTYRADSDVLASYENMHTTTIAVNDLMKRKDPSLMAAWVVSNCHSPPRERFYEEISSYISVDVYGKCGTKTLCSNNCQYDALSSAYDSRNLCRNDCQSETLSRYKFYFSLENSQCRDYISEKFWVMGLESGAVPVVMGPPRSDYELVAPPNSFIHIDDFPTVKDLAEYLVTLSRNDTLYRNYLQWREDPKWRENLPKSTATALKESRLYGNTNGLCALCQKLKHAPKDRVDIASDLDEWWFGKGYSPEGDSLSICKSGSTASGFPLRWAVTLGYTGVFLVLVGAFVCIARKMFAKGVVYQILDDAA